MRRFVVQERGQPWPMIVGSMSIPMRLWYTLLVRPWFTLHQRSNPWHWRVWDTQTRTWVMQFDAPRVWYTEASAHAWAERQNYGEMGG